MADNLVRIFGTEEDKVNCAFYHKIGACRHGDRCSRTHNRPLFSPTILIPHMYTNPKAFAVGMQVMGKSAQLDEDKVQQEFEDFYEEVWEELTSFGPLEGLYVVDNFCDHMVGNVYAMFEDEEDAQKALQNLNGRYYAGRQLIPEFSPVTDFRAATCRQFEQNCCSRGGFCNFMHLKSIGYELRQKLFKDKKPEKSPSHSKDRDHEKDRDREDRKHRHRHGSRSRSHSRSGSRGRSRSRSRSHKHRSRRD